MSGLANDDLQRLIHDVNTKCASLKDAAALLRDSSSQDTAELLRLMGQQAEDLNRAIADFAKKPRS